MEANAAKTVIGADVEITGTVKSKEPLHIDGKVDGELVCEQAAIVGKQAVIAGNITAGSVTVEGSVQGNITARDRVELKAESRLVGDLKARRLVVQEGATIVGKADVQPAGSEARAAAPAAAKDASPAAADDKSAKAKEPPRADEREGRGIFGRR